MKNKILELKKINIELKNKSTHLTEELKTQQRTNRKTDPYTIQSENRMMQEAKKQKRDQLEEKISKMKTNIFEQKK